MVVKIKRQQRDGVWGGGKVYVWILDRAKEKKTTSCCALMFVSSIKEGRTKGGRRRHIAILLLKRSNSWPNFASSSLRRIACFVLLLQPLFSATKPRRPRGSVFIVGSRVSTASCGACLPRIG